MWHWLIRFGFRLLYNEFAWTYDLVSKIVSLGRWRAWQRASIPYLKAGPDDLVLELAHGTGDLQIDLSAAGITSVGIDLSPFMGRVAERKLSRMHVRARLVRASALQLPLPSGRFQAVVSTFPTEFILDEETLQEAHRVLRPGGRFVIVLNGLLTGRGPVVGLLEWLYQVTGQRGPWPYDPLERFATVRFAAEMVTEHRGDSDVLLIVATRLDGTNGSHGV